MKTALMVLIILATQGCVVSRQFLQNNYIHKDELELLRKDTGQLFADIQVANEASWIGKDGKKAPIEATAPAIHASTEAGMKAMGVVRAE